jgi:hypothetical protein
MNPITRLFRRKQEQVTTCLSLGSGLWDLLVKTEAKSLGEGLVSATVQLDSNLGPFDFTIHAPQTK